MEHASTTATLFPVLLEGLESFRDRVEGTEGSFREALLVSGQSSLVLDVSESVLNVVCGLLRWLRDAIVLLEQRLVSVDALVAIGEVTVVLLAELGGSLEGSQGSSLPALDSMGGVSESLGMVGSIAEGLPDPSLFPEPELVAELRAVLEQLVGSATSEGSSGTLDQLLQQIQGLAA